MKTLRAILPALLAGLSLILASPPALAGSAGASVPRSGTAADAASALGNLGFKPAEASSAVAAAQEELGPDAQLDALVRLALRKAAK
jgi:Holliday junction DNA helicase RuvA